MRTLRPGENPAKEPAQRMRGLAYELAGNPNADPTMKAALALVAGIQVELSQPGSGVIRKSRGITSPLARVGTKRREKQLHQASAPGEPPAPDLGELRRTIGTDVLDNARIVGSPLPQAAALNNGAVIQRTAERKDGTVTAYTIVIEPRPFMEGGLERAKPEMNAVTVSALKAHGQTIFRPD